MANSRQPLVVLDDLGREMPNLEQQHDEAVEARPIQHVWPVGLLLCALGDACIRQILSGGPGPLGPKRERG